MDKKRRMKIKFHANLSHFIFASGLVVCVGGCSDAPEADRQKTKRPVIQVAKILPDATYDRALAVASTPEEQTIVKACRRLEGKRKTPNIDPETVQTMQEVLFESAAPEVRAAVAAGLGNAGNVDATPSLLDAMEDDALVTRQAAAKAVGKLMGWRQGFQPDDPRDKRAEAVERFRERWLLFEGSDLYQVATNPEARERAGAIAEKRAKFLRRKERMNDGDKNSLHEESPKSKDELPPQRRPTAEELQRQFKQYKDELEQYKEN